MDKLEILDQLDYDINIIRSRIRSIENTKLKIIEKGWENKPIFKGCQESIERWNKEIIESEKMIKKYYNKLF